jgi:RNA polymerase sigma-70 factor (ECF subfamily)
MFPVTLESVRDVDHACFMPDEGADSAHLDALEHQFRQVQPSLVAWFRRRVGDPSEAEDLTQECFLRITSREDPKPVEHLEGYLYRTARSVLFDRQRRRRVRRADAHVPLLPEHDDIDEIDAHRTLLAKERLRRASAVLMTMPERTRSIFILCRLEDLRYAEIATRFNISVSAVQKHMLRAIEALMLSGEEEA